MSTVSPPLRPTSLAAPVQWREVNEGLWVARVQGDIVGSVEFVRSFIATDARGDVIGSHDTLAEAQASVENPSAGFPSRASRRRFRVNRRAVAEWGLILALPLTGLALFAVIAALWIPR